MLLSGRRQRLGLSSQSIPRYICLPTVSAADSRGIKGRYFAGTDLVALLPFGGFSEKLQHSAGDIHAGVGDRLLSSPLTSVLSCKLCNLFCTI